MLGRAAYQTPALLGHIDSALFNDGGPITAYEALATYRPYMEEQLAAGTNLHAITRHMLGLFAGRPGARKYRRHISENATKPGAGLQVFDDAVGLVREAELKISV